MTMVEVNEKAAPGEQRTICEACGNSNLAYDRAAWTDDGASFCPECVALPAPDDGLVERLRYRVENPSAWDTFDQGGSDLIAEAATALQSKDEQIERLTEERCDWKNLHDAAQRTVAVRNAALNALAERCEAAEQQVQKLTAENERLREEQAGKIAEFRDKVALGASPDEILRFRDGYPNPAGGSKVFYRHTIEQARYRYADAVLAARSALETQEGGK